ncbi:co-chaperone GroES [candidate division WWE3 bacterium CG_4_10_14_0_2_um_filter_42_7]|uniref:Co-chaperonin GroES n=2 Tax=Katanobacteria TaxID=422282 RepID=A0A2H0XA12_UNCKA|nr:MAG: co-chaperone GroES [candidate division WWE3 bacterium CG08_land_8_20_14_0_20_41_15]PIZ44011.1 MAG: co-chaperone GroES [candidate division WWE3 bacterium CG_4_10_14_0_2_um_filter_42_7]
MNIKPLFDNLLIEPEKEVQEKTSSGIFIPDSAKEKPQRGLVLAVGEGKKDENGKLVPMGVKVGDLVIFKKWGGDEIKVDGKELKLVSESDVLAIVQ